MKELNNLLVEKCRPDMISGYVFPSSEVESQVKKWLKNKNIPHILLSGPPGCGKSTLSKIIINELDIDPVDVKYVNASLCSGIGFIRDELESWMRKTSFGGMKIVQFEEMDRLSADAQKALRGIMEDYSDHVRFIGTANYPKQIIDALHSRFQHIRIESLPKDDVIDLVLNIIESSGIICDDPDVLMAHIENNIPDMRKIINSIDQYTDGDNVLHAPENSTKSNDIDEWGVLWESDGELDVERALSLTHHIDQNNFDWFYEVMYLNQHKFPDRFNAIVSMSEYLARAQVCANQRLHLDAFLYQMFLIGD